jgi:hypothetical protein
MLSANARLAMADWYFDAWIAAIEKIVEEEGFEYDEAQKILEDRISRDGDSELIECYFSSLSCL